MKGMRFEQTLQSIAAPTRGEPFDPFKLPWHPPKAVPPKAVQRIAMDTSLALPTDWAGGILTNSVLEGMTFLGYPELAVLAQRPEYRVISEIISTETTRKWIAFKGTGDGDEKDEGDPKKRDREKDQPAAARMPGADRAMPAEKKTEPGEEEEPGEESDEDSEEADDKSERIKELEDELERLGVREAFAAIALQDGLFGRAHLFLDFGEDIASAELKTSVGDGRDDVSTSKIGKEKKLKALKPIEAVWCYPQVYNATNPLDPTWYNPQQWYVMGREIHVSRLLTFVGRPVSDLLKPAYSFGGLSLTQMAQPYVNNWLNTRQSVADIIKAFSVMVLKTNMPSILEAGGVEMVKRLQLFTAARDNNGVMAIDKNEEDFANIAAPLGTLDALQAQTQEHMAAVSRIPLIKLLGITPTGLNASSEGEIRAFYDTINAYQHAFMRAHLNSVIWFVMLGLWGEVDEEITWDFVPLWSMTAKEEAELRKFNAETDQILIDSGVIWPEEARKRVATDSTSLYDGLDVEDVPDLMEEEEMGLEPVGGRPQPQAETPGQKPPATKKGPGAGDRRPPFARDAEWHESDHPRGQPENAGQFGSGGGGKSKEAPAGEREEKTSSTGSNGAASKLYKAPALTPDQLIAKHGAAGPIQKVRDQIAKGISTNAPVSEGGHKQADGTYTPERAALHRKIVADIFTPDEIKRATPAPGEAPTLTMLGGRGGSGKSWLTQQGNGPVDATKSILLDSDKLKYALGSKGWDASLHHEEATDVLAMADAAATKLGVNIIHDATMKSESTALMRMAEYEAAGYEVEGFYMYASPETAADRALSRYAKNGKFNGRFVAPEIILGNVNNEKNFDKISAGMKRWAIYDNDGNAPQLVAQGGRDDQKQRV